MTVDEEYLAKVNALPKEQFPVVLDDYGIMPTSSHEDDAAYDLYTPQRIVIFPHDYETVSLGVHIAIKKGFGGFVVNRSSMNFNRNIDVKIGLVDSGYTGEIKVKIYNYGNLKQVIEKGDRIAQIMFVPFIKPKLVLVDKLEDTERGNGGFGSTGA